MQMTQGEIRRSYDAAKDKKAQICILADLNCCSRQEIKNIISDSVEQEQEEIPQETSEKPKELLKLDSAKKLLFARLDELEEQIRALEKEYSEVTTAIEVLGSFEKAGSEC